MGTNQVVQLDGTGKVGGIDTSEYMALDRLASQKRQALRQLNHGEPWHVPAKSGNRCSQS